MEPQVALKPPQRPITDVPVINRDSEALQLVPRVSFLCDGCHTRIDDQQPWWRCTVCDNFDLCPSCGKKGDHDHLLYLEAYHPTDILWNIQQMDSIAEMMQLIFHGFEFRPCLGERVLNADDTLGKYHYHTYGEMWRWARRLASALMDSIEQIQGVLLPPVPPAHAAVVGVQVDIQREYYLADYACLIYGLVSCPMVITLALTSLLYVIKHTSMTALFIHPTQALELAPLLTCTTLRVMVIVPHFFARTAGKKAALSAAAQLAKSLAPHVLVYTFDELIGRAKMLRPVRARPDDELTTLSCTSGSTGEPKLCMMLEGHTRRKSTAYSVSISRSFVYWTETVYDRWNDIRCFASGGRVACYGGNLTDMLEEVKLVEPSSVSFAPRIWNQLHAEYAQAVRDRPEALTEINEQFGGLFGRRLRLAVTGGASTAPAVLKWMQQVWGRRCAVSDSYGITEAGGLAYDGDRKDGVLMKLEDWEEYKTTDLPLARGELLVHSPAMFSGYYGLPDVTKEVLTEDGFFRTGDIVEASVDQRGKIVSVKVVGRRKAIFKLAQGEYVSPETLEGIYGESLLCEQVYVHGEALASCVSAVVVPSFAELNKRLTLVGYPAGFSTASTHEALCNSAEVVSVYRAEFRRLALRRRCRNWEVPKRILLEPERWTLANNLLTATQKLRRTVLTNKYRTRLAAASEGDVSSDNTALSEILAEVVGKESGELDSVSAIRLAATLRSALDLDVEAATLVGVPLAALTSKLASRVVNEIGGVASEATDLRKWDWELESELPESFPAELLPPSPSAHMEPLIVTGATGFVGRNLVRSLLAAPARLDLYCLVRADSSTNAIKRLAAAIGVESLPSNVTAVLGDLAKPRLGLSDATYDLLRKNAGQVLHCGAAVNHMLSYEQLRAANVDSTRDLLLLAARPPPLRPMVVHYVSTIGVFHHAVRAGFGSDDASSLVTEQTVLLSSSRLNIEAGYNQTKWVADHMLERARARHIEGVTFRPGFVGAHSITGESNLVDTDTRILAGILQLGSAPDGSVTTLLDSTPVDWFAAAIAEVILRPGTLSTLHFKHPNGPTTLASIVDAARTFGYTINEVPFAKWVNNVRAIKDSANPLYGMADLYFAGTRFPSRPAKIFNCTATANFLRARGLTAAPLDTTWVWTWIKWLKRHASLPPLAHKVAP